MGHIKEPYVIDLEIESRPLTKDESLALSEYICNYKQNSKRNNIAANYKFAQKEHKGGKLTFSSDINELKKML